MSEDVKLAGAFVRRKIAWLCEARNESAARAEMAKLRRGIGKAPGSAPDLWKMTLEDLPEALLGQSEAPSRGEWAVYTAMTLFALHQQGKDIKKQCMSKAGMPLGAAVRALVRSDEDEQRIKRRFDAAATADGLEELTHHLRGLVQLLKAEDIPLDYLALAEDVFRFQSTAQRESVRLSWGRDFYRQRKHNEGEAGAEDAADEKNTENQAT